MATFVWDIAGKWHVPQEVQMLIDLTICLCYVWLDFRGHRVWHRLRDFHCHRDFSYQDWLREQSLDYCICCGSIGTSVSSLVCS